MQPSNFESISDLIDKKDINKIFFIANNSKINWSAHEFDESALYIQYNKAIHADRINSSITHKCLFSGLTEINTPHGFNSGVHVSNCFCKNDNSVYFFTAKNRVEHVKYPMGLKDRSFTLFQSDYPWIGFNLPGHLQYSTGFFSILIFNEVNRYRLSNNMSSIKLTTVGFTGEYDNGGFLQHDFKLENNQLSLIYDIDRLDENFSCIKQDVVGNSNSNVFLKEYLTLH